MKLISAQHVKAFVRSQKDDANDATAICEIAFRLGLHFVSVKTTEQQDIKALRNTRRGPGGSASVVRFQGLVEGLLADV